MLAEMWNIVILSSTMGFTWLWGEVGRAWVIGGFGGLVRWYGEEQRTMRAAMGAWAGGAVCGVYLTPLVMWAVGYAHASDEIEHQRIYAAFVFVTGAIGISLLKILIAGIKTKTKQWGGNDA